MFGRIGGGSSSGSKGGSHESKSGGSICGIDRKDIRSVIHVSTTDKNDFKAACFTTPKGTTDCVVSHYVEPGAGNRGGDGSRSGGGGVGSQSGGFDHRLHQLHPRDAETFIERIKASESEIQRLANQYRPLNPKASEESLRSSAIITLGIATDKELEGLKNYKIEQERALQASIDEKLRSDAIQALKLAKVAEHDALHKPALREWSLGIDTASSNGRKGKVDGFIGTQVIKGISNHMVTCLQHLKTHGGVDQLKVISFSECDLAERDILYFTAKTELYPLSLNYLDFSYNKIGDIGVSYLFTGFFHLRVSVLHPTHNIISLNLSKNNIGHMGPIADYIRDGYVPHLKVLNLADNNITDTGAAHLAEGLISPNSNLKVLHLEGNKLTSAGEGYLVKALLHKATQHMIIYTQSYKGQFDEHVRMIFGTREEKVAIYKKLIAQGVEKGTNDQGIVVDKSFWGKIKHTGNQLDAARIGIGGFIKCNWQPDDVIESYAQEKFTATISKTLAKIWGKLNVVDGVVSCYFKAVDEMYTSETGQQVITHKLDVIGESEFSGE